MLSRSKLKKGEQGNQVVSSINLHRNVASLEINLDDLLRYSRNIGNIMCLNET